MRWLGIIMATIGFLFISIIFSFAFIFPAYADAAMMSAWNTWRGALPFFVWGTIGIVCIIIIFKNPRKNP
jgi:hypothetical protein